MTTGAGNASIITEGSRDDNNDVSSFLNEMNIRNRLLMTNSDNHETVSLYNSNTTNSFRYTPTVIMVPYINDNKIVANNTPQ